MQLHLAALGARKPRAWSCPQPPLLPRSAASSPAPPETAGPVSAAPGAGCEGRRSAGGCRWVVYADVTWAARGGALLCSVEPWAERRGCVSLWKSPAPGLLRGESGFRDHKGMLGGTATLTGTSSILSALRPFILRNRPDGNSYDVAARCVRPGAAGLCARGHLGLPRALARPGASQTRCTQAWGLAGIQLS